ncbi:MAG: HEAT repeat domain-containing protein [Myxococcota bacterium]
MQTVEERLASPGTLSPEEIRANRDALGQRLLSDPDAKVRADIAAALAYTARDRQSIPVLARALEAERDVGVQRRLVAALASFTDPDAVDAVVKFWLRGPDPSLEPDVLGALGGADPGLVRASLARHESLSPERAAQALASLP